MLKKLLAGLALAALAVAPISPVAAQVSLNLNAPAVDGANSGTINSATLNAAYTLPLNGGQNTVAFSLSGLIASGGTVVVEGTVDGVNWFGLNSAQGGSGALQQSFTADGTFLVNVAGRSAVRIRESVVGSGIITVTSIASVAQRDVGIDKPLPAGSQRIGFVTNQSGLGALTAVPAGSSNGTLISCPAGSSGIRFYLGAADSVTLAFAAAQPTSAPLTFKISGASGGTGPNWDENLAGGVQPYVVATTGAPLDRCY